jgi:hypothetical protein
MIARRAHAVLTLAAAVVTLATAPVAASADPGTADATFGVRGSVAPKSGLGVEGVWPLVDGSLTYFQDEAFGRLSPSGRPLPFRQANPLRALVGVLPDGRVVEQTTSGATPKPVTLILTRRRRDGRPDPSFGSGGTVRVPLPGNGYPAPIVLARDGRIAIGGPLPGGAAGRRVVLLGADGAADPVFAPFEDRADNLTTLAFDSVGRLLVGSEAVGRQGLIRRLLRDGTLDPAFTPVDTRIRPDRLVSGPGGAPILMSSNSYNISRRVLLEGDGRIVRLARAPAAAVGQAVAATFDRQGRVVLVTPEGALERLAADRNRLQVLRRRLPGGGRFGARARTVAVDRQGRIVVGGYRLIQDLTDPFQCPGVCREDLADTRGLVVRVEGGDRRVAIRSRRRGSHVVVACLAAARGGCSGTLRMKVGRATASVALHLASGTTRRYAVRAHVRGRHGALTVSIRSHDAGGELATATARLR